jgi:hypothetical protein
MAKKFAQQQGKRHGCAGVETAGIELDIEGMCHIEDRPIGHS